MTLYYPKKNLTNSGNHGVISLVVIKYVQTKQTTRPMKKRLSAYLMATLEHVCSAYCAVRGTKLTNDYENKRRDYNCSSCGEAQPSDAELIESVISTLKKNKAAGLDTLTAEHLQYSHPALATILAKLFNIMIINGYIPPDFGRMYTVPLG